MVSRIDFDFKDQYSGAITMNYDYDEFADRFAKRFWEYEKNINR